jgi:L,D-transpeptidase catalytic domain
MTGLPTPRLLWIASLSLLAALGFSGCGTTPFGRDTRNKMIVSVSDQKMLLVKDGNPVKTYKISTSKFGVGDRPGSNCTPLGRLQVAKKIGGNAPIGSVFKSRRPTGEILRPNAPGRDPVVTRILWLTGTESRNRNAFRRTIYIHGTPEERRLGAPASYVPSNPNAPAKPPPRSEKAVSGTAVEKPGNTSLTPAADSLFSAARLEAIVLFKIQPWPITNPRSSARAKPSSALSATVLKKAA